MSKYDIINEFLSKLFFVSIYEFQFDKPFCIFYDKQKCIDYLLKIPDEKKDVISLIVNGDDTTYDIDKFIEVYRYV